MSLASTIENPRKCSYLVDLFERLFSQHDIVTFILTHLKEQGRLIVDISNAFFALIEKFKNTLLELRAKLAYARFHDILIHSNFKDNFQKLVADDFHPVGTLTLSSEVSKQEAPPPIHPPPPPANRDPANRLPTRVKSFALAEARGDQLHRPALQQVRERHRSVHCNTPSSSPSHQTIHPPPPRT